MSTHDPMAKRPRDLICKGCGKDNRDQKMVQFSDGNIKCFACDYLDVDPKNRDFKPKEFEYKPVLYKSIPESYIRPYFTGGSTMLENFLFDKFGNNYKAAMDIYGIGRDQVSGRTAFIFKDYHQNYRYVKSVQYLPNGKRDKEQYPYVPYKSRDGFKPCLFGEHLLMGYNGKINLVESEKTAIIASIKFPDQLWLATSGSNGLTHEKAENLRGRTVYKWVDCDKAGRNVDRDRKVLAYFNASLQVRDIDKTRDDGWDLADEILKSL